MDSVLRISFLFLPQAISMFVATCFVGWLIRTTKGEGGKFPFGTCAVAAILLATLLTALELQEEKVRLAKTAPDILDLAKVYGHSGDVLAPQDLATVEKLSSFTRSNNIAAARLVRVLADETLERGKWLELVDEPIRELRDTCQEMDDCVLSIDDAGLKAGAEEVTIAFRRQLKCVEAIREAVSEGNEESKEKAFESLLEARDERQKVAAKYITRLRELLPSDVLHQQLEERRKELDSVIQPPP